MRLRDFNETFRDDLRDPEFMEAYLDDALSSGDEKTFFVALGNVVKAQIGFSSAARAAEVGRESLYRSLSEGGNPQFATVEKVLRSLGLRLRVIREDTVVSTGDEREAVPA